MMYIMTNDTYFLSFFKIIYSFLHFNSFFTVNNVFTKKSTDFSAIVLEVYYALLLESELVLFFHRVITYIHCLKDKYYHYYFKLILLDQVVCMLFYYVAYYLQKLVLITRWQQLLVSFRIVLLGIH